MSITKRYVFVFEKVLYEKNQAAACIVSTWSDVYFRLIRRLIRRLHYNRVNVQRFNYPKWASFNPLNIWTIILSQ